jgi:hypothetical protein
MLTINYTILLCTLTHAYFAACAVKIIYLSYFLMLKLGIILKVHFFKLIILEWIKWIFGTFKFYNFLIFWIKKISSMKGTHGFYLHICLISHRSIASCTKPFFFPLNFLFHKLTYGFSNRWWLSFQIYLIFKLWINFFYQWIILFNVFSLSHTLVIDRIIFL